MAKEHIYLGCKYSEKLSFTPIGTPVNEKVTPDRDVNIHAAQLKEWYSGEIGRAHV